MGFSPQVKAIEKSPSHGGDNLKLIIRQHNHLCHVDRFGRAEFDSPNIGMILQSCYKFRWNGAPVIGTAIHPDGLWALIRDVSVEPLHSVEAEKCMVGHYMKSIDFQTARLPDEMNNILLKTFETRAYMVPKTVSTAVDNFNAIWEAEVSDSLDMLQHSQHGQHMIERVSI